MEDVNIIIEKIKTTAAHCGYDTTDNIDKIARAKSKFFGVKNWAECPCDSTVESKRACISKACQQEIEQNGVCHCQLYQRKAG